MEKIYKFLRDNNIEDINCLIEYRLGKVVYNNPDNIDIDIRTNPKTSIIYVIMKEGDNILELSSNNSLNTFLMNNMPIEEIGKLLLRAYIEDNGIYSINDLIYCIYDNCYLSACTVNTIREDIYLQLEFEKELKVKKVYFKYEDKKKGIIEVDLNDFYEIISSLEE